MRSAHKGESLTVRSFRPRARLATLSLRLSRSRRLPGRRALDAFGHRVSQMGSAHKCERAAFGPIGR